VDEDAFAAIRARFRERCHADLALVRRALIDSEISATPPFRLHIHKLAGLAGSLGFPQLGALAADVDDVLADGGLPGHDELTNLEAALSHATTAPG
jgi:HPt (histidine-containing phosphotransfer) domain-containing protein